MIPQPVPCPRHSTYTAAKVPTASKISKDCDGCWEMYNQVHDLPPGSRVTAKQMVGFQRLSRNVPPVDSVHSVLGTPYKRSIDDLTLPVTMLKRKGFEPLAFGIDASLRATGAAVLGRIPDALQASGWRHLALTFKEGEALTKEATAAQSVGRYLRIAAALVRALKLVGSTKASPVPIYLEGYAYSAASGGARQGAYELCELHGVIKSQMLLTFGVCPVVLAPQQAPSRVYHDKDCRKEDARRCLIEAGWEWVGKLTLDEIDALGLVLYHLVQQSAGH